MPFSGRKPRRSTNLIARKTRADSYIEMLQPLLLLGRPASLVSINGSIPRDRLINVSTYCSSGNRLDLSFKRRKTLIFPAGRAEVGQLCNGCFFFFFAPPGIKWTIRQEHTTSSYYGIIWLILRWIPTGTRTPLSWKRVCIVIAWCSSFCSTIHKVSYGVRGKVEVRVNNTGWK